MLTSLSIHNYALISSLEVNFNEGLSAITGETGAGKSILMGALGLVLGTRADSTVLIQVFDTGFEFTDFLFVLLFPFRSIIRPEYCF